MAINTGSRYESYHTKDLSNCVSDTVKVELEAVHNLYLKARMVNERSNYTINVNQDNSKVDNPLIFILCCLGF